MPPKWIFYDYNRARDRCHKDPQAYDECVKAVADANRQKADPFQYFRDKERREQEARQELAKQYDDAMAQCPSARDNVKAAIRDGDYRNALRIATQSSVCANRAQIENAFIGGLKTVSAERIAAYADDNVAMAYWHPIEIWSWLQAASKGRFIRDRGVYFAARVQQQFGDYVVVDGGSPEARCVIRLDRQRYLAAGQVLNVIGRFREIGHFEIVSGIRSDAPIFDVVYAF